MNTLRTSLLLSVLAALVACSTPLGPAQDAPRTPSEVQENVELQPEERTPSQELTVPEDDCAEIIERANATQDPALQGELESCLQSRLTPIASTSGEEEGESEEEGAEGCLALEDLGEIADCVMDELEAEGVELPDLEACEALLEDEDLEGFVECAADAIWDGAELPEFEDACADLLEGAEDDPAAADAFAECLADELDAPEDVEVPVGEDLPCIDLLTGGDLDAFGDCVEDHLEELCGDEEEAQPEDPAEEPADEGEGPALPELPCDELFEEALDSDTDAAWDAFDACAEQEEASLASCFDILDDMSLSDEEAWDAFDACVDGI